jgi:negative regulator of flagellin synthesis FlgM
MKIGPLEPKAAVVPVGGERSSAAAAPAKPHPAGQEESAKVELSAAALAVTEGNADFDAEKVQRIAQAIRDGKYEVNADVIADKLIANARELLDRSSR